MVYKGLIDQNNQGTRGGLQPLPSGLYKDGEPAVISKYFLYKCDPVSPSPNEIARLTDYIVAYACKGNETIDKEMKKGKL